MATVTELKEIIVGLRMELLKFQVPEGNCLWRYISTEPERNCSQDCNSCRKKFLEIAEKDIREEIEQL